MARQPGIGRSVEGNHAVAAAAAAGRITALAVEASRRDQPAIRSIIDDVRSAGASVEFVDSVTPQASTDAPQGVVAQGRPIATHSIDDLAGASKPALLVLDHIEDPHNLGAIARSAAAAGMTGLVTTSRRAAPFSASAFKAAAGALERLPVAVVGSVASAIDRLGSRQVWTVGLAANATQPLFGLALLDQPCAVVVGAEGTGLSNLVAERCDVLVSIPMASGESLNASVAAAIASYEVIRIRAKL